MVDKPKISKSKSDTKDELDSNDAQIIATNALTKSLENTKYSKFGNQGIIDNKNITDLKGLKHLIKTKDQILKEMKRTFKNKLPNSTEFDRNTEIDYYLEKIPKLDKLYRFKQLNIHDIRQIRPLYKKLKLSKNDFMTVLKRYPYILKMDIDNDVIPRMEGIKDIFPNCDYISIFIDSPVLISQDTNYWITKRDRINNYLNITDELYIKGLSRRPGILFNSIIKSTLPRVRFFTDKCLNKSEFIKFFVISPYILKTGWGRLARFEFLRSKMIPKKWKIPKILPPNYENKVKVNPIWKKELNDTVGLNDDLSDESDDDEYSAGNIGKYKTDFVRDKEKFDRKVKEYTNEWSINEIITKWHHRRMTYTYPYYIKFLREYTLRIKNNDNWTIKDVEMIKTKEMEDIIGNYLYKKYSNKRMDIIRWRVKGKKPRFNVA